MRPAARVVVCADDFGMAEAVNQAVAELLFSGAINAATCLTRAPAWAEGAGRLREVRAARPHAMLGLHLDLPSPLTPADRALAEFRAQWAAFEDDLGARPDFVDGHRHIHLFPGPRRALFRLLGETGARPWLRQCRTSSTRFSPKRWLLDPLSDRFRREAGRLSYALNPGFGGLRRFDPLEDVARLWRRDLAAMADGGLLMVHPGGRDAERLSACRAQEAALIRAGAIADALAAAGLALAQARTPWDAPAGRKSTAAARS
ncbi:MAG: ChbG/HpnK family deacetylase [Caulobacteraceae bacterium]|nr:ChbG/HpnK family deacetylase [Caulobacteraceae bacterium]